MPTRRTFLQSSAALSAAGVLASGAAAADVEKPGRTPRTKFAVNVDLWWPKLPFDQRLEQAARLGYDAFEFGDWRRKDVSLEAVAAACERVGIRPVQFLAWGAKPGLNDPANHRRFLDEVGSGCEAALRLRCPAVTVLGGDDVEGKTQAQMHDAIIEGLKRAAPVAERAGVTLLLEPLNVRVDHKGHSLYGSAPALRIVKEVGSRAVKLSWDFYHMQVTEGDLCGHLREAFRQGAVGYVRAADHPGRTEPGTGEIHYPRLFKELAALGYRSHVGLACRPSRTEAEAAQAVHRADSAW